ncbi:MAG: GTPase, partial [Candidatus Baltobacteraceae bacterium]
ATLDPTLRQVYLGGDLHVRMADTVGFITALPQELINAFRATLEELDEADLLLHVVDASNPDWPRQMASVRQILGDLQLEAKPGIVVFNKCDAIRGEVPHEPGALAISAKSGVGVQELKRELRERLQ